MPITIGGKVTLAIVDTGAHRTVMDTKMAAALGLQVRRAPSNYGRFSVPGSDAVHAYTRVLAGESVLQLNGRVLARVNNLRVIEHPRPFFLLGADILWGGRPADQWNFTGLMVVNVYVNEVKASLGFDVRGQEVSVPLPHAPAGEPEEERQATAHVSGGQHLRHNIR